MEVSTESAVLMGSIPVASTFIEFANPAEAPERLRPFLLGRYVVALSATLALAQPRKRTPPPLLIVIRQPLAMLEERLTVINEKFPRLGGITDVRGRDGEQLLVAA